MDHLASMEIDAQTDALAAQTDALDAENIDQPMPNEILAIIFRMVPCEIFRYPPARAWREFAVEVLSGPLPIRENKSLCLRTRYDIPQISVGLAILFPGRFDWTNLANYHHAPEWFIRRFDFHIDLTRVYRPWSTEFIGDYRTRVNWEYTSRHHLLTAEFVGEFTAYINWRAASSNLSLTDEVLANYAAKLDWTVMCEKRQLSEAIMTNFSARLDWKNVSKYQRFGLNFAHRHTAALYWHLVPPEHITDEIIRSLAAYMSWNVLSARLMTDEFMAEFGKYITWQLLPKEQVIPEAVIRQHYRRMDWPAVSRYQVLTEKFIEDFEYYVHWSLIFAFQKLSAEFVEKYWCYFCLQDVLPLKYNPGQVNQIMQQRVVADYFEFGGRLKSPQM